MIVIVCGGRNFRDRYWAYRVLDHMHEQHWVTLLVHGDAPGADQIAGDWARDRGVCCEPCPADWQTFGRRAGPIRNARMLRDWHPDMVVAFPGGKGTSDMIDKAEKRNVAVFDLRTGPQGEPTK